MNTPEKIAAIEELLKAALSSQYTDDYQQGRSALAGEIEVILGRDEDDAPIPADPRFPDRPTHPDFARLSAAVLVNDARADAGEDVPAIFEADGDSLVYMVEQRMHTAFGFGVHMIPEGMQTMMQALFIDGFTVGIQFERRGGPRPAETGNAGDKEGSE